MTKKTTQKQIKQLFSMHFISELREETWLWELFCHDIYWKHKI